jgi:hypothetical protein
VLITPNVVFVSLTKFGNSGLHLEEGLIMGMPFPQLVVSAWYFQNNRNFKHIDGGWNSFKEI